MPVRRLRRTGTTWSGQFDDESGTLVVDQVASGCDPLYTVLMGVGTVAETLPPTELDHVMRAGGIPRVGMLSGRPKAARFALPIDVLTRGAVPDGTSRSYGAKVGLWSR